jgi:hypothetical protein
MAGGQTGGQTDRKLGGLDLQAGQTHRKIGEQTYRQRNKLTERLESRQTKRRVTKRMECRLTDRRTNWKKGCWADLLTGRLTDRKAGSLEHGPTGWKVDRVTGRNHSPS